MLVVNVTTRNVSCSAARRWMIREFENYQNLGRDDVWWRRFGNHVPVYWRCRSRVNSGRTSTDIRCASREGVVHWQHVWDG